MRVINDPMEVTVTVRKEEVIDGHFLEVGLLSKKVRAIELENPSVYYGLRSRLYNSMHSRKYNTSVIYGLSCIDMNKPMLNESASLVLSFKEE